MISDCRFLGTSEIEVQSIQPTAPAEYACRGDENGRVIRGELHALSSGLATQAQYVRE